MPTWGSPAQITSVKPIPLKGFGSALGVVVVALHYTGALGQQQALLTVRHILVCLGIHHPQAGPRDGLACATQT